MSGREIGARTRQQARGSRGLVSLLYAPYAASVPPYAISVHHTPFQYAIRCLSTTPYAVSVPSYVISVHHTLSQ
eukprot:3444855-Rhodomonas_salina.2